MYLEYNFEKNESFEYEVDVKFEDFFAFNEPIGFDDMSKEEQNGFIRGLRIIWRSNWFRTDDLEEDEDFIQFMKDRYYEDAKIECEEMYGEED